MGGCRSTYKAPHCPGCCSSVQVPVQTTLTRMPNIKLTYFDLRARAEPCRLLLAYAGANTEDEKPKKKGRKKKVLNDEELAEREKERKRKYKEQREKQKEKVEKRKQYLIRKREERKAMKIEEKKKHEEHMKRMAELRSQYLDDNAVDLPPPGTPGNESAFLMDENSQSSMGSVPVTTTERKKRKAWGDVGCSEMNGVHNPLANVTAENLFEYKWPLEGRHSEHYFLQEQVTEYLGVKSFKRKYPDCPRRTINMEERDFLIEIKIE